jgi:hypothetical protein
MIIIVSPALFYLAWRRIGLTALSEGNACFRALIRSDDEPDTYHVRRGGRGRFYIDIERAPGFR